MSLNLLTADEADSLHETKRQNALKEAQEMLERQRKAQEENEKRYLKEELPALIEEYVAYLAEMQREKKMPFNVKSPPDHGEDVINERLKQFGLRLECRCTDHEFNPIRYSLTRL